MKTKTFILRDKIILFGGRLSDAKGAFQALLILAKVLEKVPNTTLVIMGTETLYTEQLLASAKNKFLDEHIKFTGWITGDELKATYHAADILLTPSIYLDPFPTVNLEAMACRVPVVGTCFGGTCEVVKDGVTGYIVNPFDIDTVANRIVDLLTNEQKSVSFGDAGHQRVKQDFSIEKQTDEYMSWFMKDYPPPPPMTLLEHIKNIPHYLALGVAFTLLFTMLGIGIIFHYR